MARRYEQMEGLFDCDIRDKKASDDNRNRTILFCNFVVSATLATEMSVEQFQKDQDMLRSLSQPQVKSALDAWQRNDLPAWLEHFSVDAKLFDDGSPRDFKKFSSEIGKERFTSIEMEEDGGMSIFGHFHSDQWGDFKTYFKLHLASDGKFDRLDIGQANY